MGKIDTAELVKKAKELKQENTQLVAERRENRELLRLLDSNDQLTEKESEEVNAIYPPRQQGSDELEGSGNMENTD